MTARRAFLQHAQRACFALALVHLGAAGCSEDTLAQATQPDPESERGTARFGGVNLAGGEFGAELGPLAQHGRDYIYPDRATAEPFLAIGMNAVRVPVVWERLQPEAFGPLDPSEMQRVDQAIAAMDGFAMIILDVHNYAKYRGQRLDQVDHGADILADLWGRLAAHYRDNGKLAFGLMNEPVDITAAQWRDIAKASVSAIREHGATNLILVPGTNFTGAHSWLSAGPFSNGDALAGFEDPGGNFAFEIHQYFDADSSGSHPECVEPEIAVGRLEDATGWLRAEGRQGFLGEFGLAPNTQCLETLESVMRFLDTNADAWLGWTVWAGGAWWGDYPLSVQPSGGTMKPQVAVLKRHLPRP